MSDSSLALRGFGILARKWAGDLRFRDLYLDVNREDDVRKYRIPLHDAVAVPTLTWMATGGVSDLASGIIRSIYDRDAGESFVLKSVPEDDFAIGLMHLSRVPGIEKTVSHLRALYEDRRRNLRKKDTKIKSFPLGGSLGAIAIHDLVLQKG